MTDEEAAEKMMKISKSIDTEGAHVDADQLLLKLLNQLGYKKTVRAYREVHKWYA